MTTIACLAWGSLVWDTRDLPIASEWFPDGPMVQVDFLRQSKNGRMTLVLNNGAWTVPSLWAVMASTDREQARCYLGNREEVQRASLNSSIGAWSCGEPSPQNVSELGLWAKQRGVDHVVWTALPAKFGSEVRTPSDEEVISYLRGLDGERREKAECYIRRAPRQVDTRLRRLIAAELNWQPID